MQQPTEPEVHTPAADPGADETLVSEMDHRYDFGGLSLINRATGEPEGHADFTRDEIDMPGYVESVERGYEGTPWRTLRMWNTTGPTT